MDTIIKTLTFIGHSILEDLGIPVSLKKVLETHAKLGNPFDGTPAKNISAQSVIQWDRWGEGDIFGYPRRTKGELLGWGYHNGTYGSYTESSPEFNELVKCDVTESWSCDISDVYGFCASKSNLRKFESIAEMVTTNSKEMITPVCDELLQKNLNHHEIRIIHRSDSSDYFASHSWDRRLFLMNSGGSHHFGAAQYIAANLQKKIGLTGRHRFYYFNYLAIQELLKKYEIFAIAFTNQGINELHDAMRRYRASFFSTYLPFPFNNQKAILLPKTDLRACKVSALFKEHDVFNLGLYLHSEGSKSKAMGY